MRAKAHVIEDVMNGTLVSIAIAALLCTTASIVSAQQDFKTPDEAASALASAAKAGDRKAIVTVLGPDGQDIVSSGDRVADAATRQKFVAAYDAKHQIAMEGDNKADASSSGKRIFRFRYLSSARTGYGGSTQLPVVKKFSSVASVAMSSTLFQSCLAYVMRKTNMPRGIVPPPANTYAQRIISAPGKKDGLYWPDVPGEDASPLGRAHRRGNRARLSPGRRANAVPWLLFQYP